MTIMGMAASQARFLGLTARKSNVEYQGQQVNQQRTALSNESANLYNEMMELVVPTPPSTSDYYKTVYTLEDSAGSYAKENYTISNVTKTYARENQYNITLLTKKSQTAVTSSVYTLQRSTYVEKDNPSEGEEPAGTHKEYTITLVGGNSTMVLDYNEIDTNAYDNKGKLEVKNNQIYAISDDPEKANKLNGYKECNEARSADDEEYKYFYMDDSGVNHFITQTELDDMLANNEDSRICPENIYEYSKEFSTQVLGYLDTSSSTGRYSTISIENNDEYPIELNNKTFSLTCKESYDENAYNDAYNDYEYAKTTYEKQVADLNAKTKVLQQQDQRLELKLKQLDTEENAIKIEMDSVKEVLKNNVETTFKTFA